MLRNKYVIGIVAVLFLGVAFFNVAFLMKRPQKAGPGDDVQRTSQQPGKTMHVNVQLPPPVPADGGKWKRDPFLHKADEGHGLTGHPGAAAKTARIVERKQKDSGIKLKGILVGKGKRYAIVNEGIMQVGDRIGDGVITAIERHRIIIEEGKERKIINMIDVIDREG